MQTNTQVTFLFIDNGSKIDLRQAAFDLGQLRPLCALEDTVIVAGARRDGQLIAMAFTRVYDDPMDAIVTCIDALAGEGAEAAVAYSPQTGMSAPDPDPGDRRVIFAVGRCLAAARHVHLVDWLLYGANRPESLRSSFAGESTWWDVPDS